MDTYIYIYIYTYVYSLFLGLGALWEGRGVVIPFLKGAPSKCSGGVLVKVGRAQMDRCSAETIHVCHCCLTFMLLRRCHLL